MTLPELRTDPPDPPRRSGTVVPLEEATTERTAGQESGTERAITLQVPEQLYQSYEAVCVERNRYFLGMMAAFGLSAILVVAITLILPLKETRPFVIHAADGAPLTVVPDAEVAELSQDEALTKHWVAKYVQYRESYNWRTVERFGEFVQSMSSVDAADAYLRYMSPSNRESPLNRFARDFERVTQVESVSFLGETTTTGERSAIVRFSATTRGLGGSVSDEHWSALLTFAYLPETLMADEIRLVVNPLGFTVTSYSATKELS